MSWLDPVFAVLVGTLTAFGAARRLAGFTVGVGAVLLIRPILGVAEANLWAGLVAALFGGAILASLGRSLFANKRSGATWQKGLGAVGGAGLGLALVMALVISLPIQRSPFDPNQILYPPRTLPGPIQSATAGSWTVALGRDVLLFPLLDADEMPEGRQAVLGTLHRWFVIGEPWRVDGGDGS